MPLLNHMALYWPATSWPVTFAACSGGFTNIIYTFGVGYGTSMMANAGLAALVAKRRGITLTPFGAACCCLYGAYGLRLTTFLLRRQNDPSYAPKLHAMEVKTSAMDIGSRFALVAGVSFSQALYALPLYVATSTAARNARPVLKIFGWAGVGVAAAGLFLEHVADEQKLAAKQHKPHEPVMDGLYAYCKHPNYCGELLFHVGVSCFAVTGASVLQAAACAIAPFFMASVMVNSARRLDREGDHRYPDRVVGYREWASSTPTLFPFPRRTVE
eukprot:TRINITY_DN60738_c0_g1_i1.p1 TRINITY_DN60738_c0_g1~~TRINITY_DN60738_c0_g1_i1.p1  ORF type:complete len:286 (+),score=28.25 TRINITY_DN60738_c0_g1_i1:44-859(+)